MFNPKICDWQEDEYVKFLIETATPKNIEVSFKVPLELHKVMLESLYQRPWEKLVR